MFSSVRVWGSILLRVAYNKARTSEMRLLPTSLGGEWRVEGFYIEVVLQKRAEFTDNEGMAESKEITYIVKLEEQGSRVGEFKAE